MKKLLCIILTASTVFCFVAPLAKAASIDYGELGGFVRNSDNTLSANNNAVLLGTFTLGFDFASNATNFAATFAAFTEYGHTFIGDPGSGPTAGEFFATATPTGVSGKQLYIWVFNVPFASISSATEWAIVTNTTLSAWLAPGDTPPSNTTSIDVSDSGTVVPTGAKGLMVGSDVKMQSVIPEPSSLFLLSSAGLLALIRRRRG